MGGCCVHPNNCGMVVHTVDNWKPSLSTFCTQKFDIDPWPRLYMLWRKGSVADHLCKSLAGHWVCSSCEPLEVLLVTGWWMRLRNSCNWDTVHTVIITGYSNFISLDYLLVTAIKATFRSVTGGPDRIWMLTLGIQCVHLQTCHICHGGSKWC